MLSITALVSVSELPQPQAAVSLTGEKPRQFAAAAGFNLPLPLSEVGTDAQQRLAAPIRVPHPPPPAGGEGLRPHAEGGSSWRSLPPSRLPVATTPQGLCAHQELWRTPWCITGYEKPAMTCSQCGGSLACPSPGYSGIEHRLCEWLTTRPPSRNVSRGPQVLPVRVVHPSPASRLDGCCQSDWEWHFELQVM